MAREIPVAAVSPERFRALLPAERFEAFEAGGARARALLEGRVVWNVNSTARGGGVVELVLPLVGYARGLGIDARWAVIDGPPQFFTLTKRIHNRLHGVPGDGGELDDAARSLYERVLAANLEQLAPLVRPGDVVIVHDPQPAGMVAGLRSAGASVIWRCHVGLDNPNEIVRETWAFLEPYVRAAEVYVFSRASFAWDGLARERIVVIAPSIDAFSPKNEDLGQPVVLDVMRASGLLAGAAADARVTFRREDGSAARVERRARVVEDEQPAADVPLVVQVSRWDPLKDPVGVIAGFGEHVAADTGAHLVYAGPDVEGVADDPEGQRVLRASLAARERLPAPTRSRVHLASLPVDDPGENAVVVNALQRHARVIVQKSLAEGFGLTVAEAMWKARPVIASRIGGIQDQIVDGESGVLLDDPRDLSRFGAEVARLLREPALAEDMGRRARECVRERFLSVRSLLDYLAVIEPLVTARGA